MRGFESCSAPADLCSLPFKRASCRETNGFKNRYLSVFRLKTYEQCPLAFKLRYIEKANPVRDPTAFEMGTLVHEALEMIYLWIIAEEFSGYVPIDVITQSYRKAFEASKVATVELFQEGLEIVRRYFKMHPQVDHRSILAVEQEFNIKIGDYWVNGFIDRVDKPADDEIEVLDYKTNRLLFTQEEVDSDIQASIYTIACQELYPWARKIKFGFDMLRFDVRLRTERNQDQLKIVEDYVSSIGKRSESLESGYPAKLNSFCAWCDFRTRCPDYAKALSGELLDVVLNTDDIESLTRERERISAVAKIAEARKRTIEKHLKDYIQEHGPFSANGLSYSLDQYFSKHYPLEKTIELLKLRTGLPEDDIRKEILVIDSKRMDEFVKSIDIRSATKTMLKAELASVADRKPQKPRIEVRKT